MNGSPAPRTAVNHCPYCGEDTLRPTEHDRPDAWHCLSCLRVFTVSHHGVRHHSPTGSPR